MLIQNRKDFNLGFLVGLAVAFGILVLAIFTKYSFDYDNAYVNEPASIIGTSCGEDSGLLKYEIGDYYLCTECKRDDEGVYVWYEDEYCEKWREEIE